MTYLANDTLDMTPEVSKYSATLADRPPLKDNLPCRSECHVLGCSRVPSRDDFDFPTRRQLKLGGEYDVARSLLFIGSLESECPISWARTQLGVQVKRDLPRSQPLGTFEGI